MQQFLWKDKNIANIFSTSMGPSKLGNKWKCLSQWEINSKSLLCRHMLQRDIADRTHEIVLKVRALLLASWALPRAPSFCLDILHHSVVPPRSGTSCIWLSSRSSSGSSYCCETSCRLLQHWRVVLKLDGGQQASEAARMLNVFLQHAGPATTCSCTCASQGWRAIWCCGRRGTRTPSLGSWLPWQGILVWWQAWGQSPKGLGPCITRRFCLFYFFGLCSKHSVALAPEGDVGWVYMCESHMSPTGHVSSLMTAYQAHTVLQTFL